MPVRRLPVSWDIPTSYPAAEVRKRVALAGSALLIERLAPTVTGRAYVQLVRDGDNESEVERIPVREGDQLRDGPFKYLTFSVLPPVVPVGIPTAHLDALQPFARFAVADCPGELPSRLARTAYPLLSDSNAGTGPNYTAINFGCAAVELYNLYLVADGAVTVMPAGTYARPPRWDLQGAGVINVTRAHPLHLGSLDVTVTQPQLMVNCGAGVTWALTVEYLPRQEA